MGSGLAVALKVQLSRLKPDHQPFAQHLNCLGKAWQLRSVVRVQKTPDLFLVDTELRQTVDHVGGEDFVLALRSQRRSAIGAMP